MSEFLWETCACGGGIQAVTPDEDDIRIAVAAHNETRRHVEWRAVQALKKPAPKGPCICRGGERPAA